MGKHLLRKNVIKIGIPLVGVPLAAVLNHYTTLLAGRQAQAVFRNEARVIEIADNEALLMRHLVRTVRERHQVVDEELAGLVGIDPAEVWRRMDTELGDLSGLLDAADRVATVDGPSTRVRRPSSPKSGITAAQPDTRGLRPRGARAPGGCR
ncbi:hypothetical protein ACFWN1_29200 [Streptomyces sp. NPDC058459]|uniref:hypothetical protein n=1 Tax=Streptomyces sp. NPDC058459 TaxID=3346508 RepID=UPI003659272F